MAFVYLLRQALACCWTTEVGGEQITALLRCPSRGRDTEMKITIVQYDRRCWCYKRKPGGRDKEGWVYGGRSAILQGVVGKEHGNEYGPR